MTNKFTIIIPTRERFNTLYHTIKTCLNQTYQNYQIIVSDNYSKDDTYNIVHSFHDCRLKYINTGKRVSMSENFDFALSHVTDGYVMFIGDDDGILPNSLEYVNKIINETGIEAIVSHNAFYTWPGTPNPNRLFWSQLSGYEIRDSKEWIQKYLTFKMQYTFDLPGAYCGFVKREVFDRVTKDGLFFRSATPDSYSAIAVAFATKKYIYSYSAFAAHGASTHSLGGSSLNTKKNSEGEAYKKCISENTISLHPSLTSYKAFRLTSLDSFLYFADAFPELTKNYKIDWKLFLQYVLTERQENTKEEIEEAVKMMCKIHSVDFEKIKDFKPNKLYEIYDLSFSELIKKITNKVSQKILRKTVQIEDVTKYGVYNVHDAMLLLKFYLNERV